MLEPHCNQRGLIAWVVRNYEIVDFADLVWGSAWTEMTGQGETSGRWLLFENLCSLVISPACAALKPTDGMWRIHASVNMTIFRNNGLSPVAWCQTIASTSDTLLLINIFWPSFHTLILAKQLQTVTERVSSDFNAVKQSNLVTIVNKF